MTTNTTMATNSSPVGGHVTTCGLDTDMGGWWWSQWTVDSLHCLSVTRPGASLRDQHGPGAGGNSDVLARDGHQQG